MSTIRLSLLGPPRLEREGEPVELDTRKTVALLAYLAMTGQSPGGQTHRREALATLLWPEAEPQRARANLRRSLSVLRKGLGGEWLVADRETIGIHPHADIWLDVAHFRRLLSSPQAHGHPEAETCPDCLKALAEAVVLYRGDFLEGFGLRDSASFDDWQFFQTEGLRQELALALERLVHGYNAQGTYEQAIPYGRRWVALDPLHEPAQRELIQLYALASQRAAALRQYTECARILEAELGIPPAEETTSLYERIRTSPAIGEELVRPVAQPRHNLPAQTTPFVGREEELEAIRARLCEPTCRLLTLVGPGGVGKTRLALEAASSLVPQMEQDGFVDGVYLVRMAQLESSEALVPAVAKALGFSFYGEAESSAGPDPQQQLLDHLRQKRLLLLMDNFEHLLEGVQLVNAMLTVAPDVKVLATSRARLGLQGEHLYTVTGMQFPDTLSPAGVETPEGALAYSAVRLFVQAAHRVRPDFEPPPEEFAAIVRICRLVEGMPLGILLAAAWVDMLSSHEIAAEVERSLDFLATDLQDLPERQRSIRAVFEHSWNLLTDREREVFQGLSVFRGGFTREAAQQVTGAELHELKSLVNKSLVQPTSASRYEMHELLRQYAADRLDRITTTGDATRGRHSIYYTSRLQRLEAELKGTRRHPGPPMDGRVAAQAVAEIDLEIENMRAAWQWAAAHGQIEQIDRAMDSLAIYYRWRSHHAQGKMAFRQAAEWLSEVMSPDPSGEEARILARLLAWQSRLWGDESDRALVQQGLSLLQEPEPVSQELAADTRQARALLLQQMGWLEGSNGPEMARAYCQESLALYESLDDRYGMAEVLDTLGTLVRGQGDYDEAWKLYERCLALRREIGDTRGIARSLLRLSSIAQFQGQPAESAHLAREGIAISRSIGDQGGMASGLADLAATLLWLGEFAQAESVLEESPALHRNLGFYSASSSMLQSEARAHLGRYGEARVQAEAALALSREIGHRPHIGLACWLLGCLLLAEGAHTEARVLFQESAQQFREMERQEQLGWALAGLACAEHALDNHTQAQQFLYEVLGICTEIGSMAVPLLPTFTLTVVALWLADLGEVLKAVELYALASRYPHVARSRWFQDLFERPITEAASTLPPGLVKAAEERGRSRDMMATVSQLLAELGG
jgi:predicted ATPase/DNA-binding SARP family transcriptional activator